MAGEGSTGQRGVVSVISNDRLETVELIRRTSSRRDGLERPKKERVNLNATNTACSCHWAQASNDTVRLLEMRKPIFEGQKNVRRRLIEICNENLVGRCIRLADEDVSSTQLGCKLLNLHTSDAQVLNRNQLASGGYVRHSISLKRNHRSLLVPVPGGHFFPQYETRDRVQRTDAS